ncbi:lipopolysaccharide-induced tumor necrosis factor-alpha factor homolog isoform X2 [Pseudoliparis swirei]|uniref:lipopolysaccharide-induced tumor necrosis factor-alpha factor homolog isoform X2 n=1 Tax=Pseudoliparis swirei TaxID=2059687 RepID=UPI0024BEB7B1|nr:lipopolysaccharide-induced tumor necrosis factor-alpha factor homolog isoform X2 [Pseudoliparis swirei]
MDQVQEPLQTSGPRENSGRRDGSGPETRSGPPRPPPRADMEFRIKELHNRHFLLLKMQRFRKKVEENGTAEGMTCEDQRCELEAIQEELEELLRRKEEMEAQRRHFKLGANKGPQSPRPTAYKTEAPCGGVYMLPPPQLEEQDFTPEERGRRKRKRKRRPGAETPPGAVTPVDFLGAAPALTKCPFCGELVVTEVHSRVGGATWTVAFLCALAGCVAGCCLIPFCTRRLNNADHRCSQCRAVIHTHRPF